MRIAFIIGVGLGLGLLAVRGAEGQGPRCYALAFPDSAPAYPEGVAGDTLVLSDVPLGDLEDLLPGGRRAFLGLAAYREPAPLTYRVDGWRPVGRDSIEIRPLLFMVALIWRAEIMDDGLRGEAQWVTDEIGAPEPRYRFRGAQVSCGTEGSDA